MYMKNCWYAAAFSEEVGRHILSRTFLDCKTIIYRTEAGQVVAMADRCAHRSVPLSMGELVGDTVRCRYHGLCYDKEGSCVSVPGQTLIPTLAKVMTYPIVEKYRVVWIWLGDSALADPALIPDVYWLDHPEWVPSAGYHLIAANYQLLIDNLLDLSHETYVHPHTIGNSAVAASPLTVNVVAGREVQAHRDMLNCEPPPFYVSAAQSNFRIDRWHTTTFIPPGVCVIQSGSVPAGMEKQEAGAKGLKKERRNLNFITPETATSSHYFWASTRDYSLDDAALTEFIRKEVAFTFDQDKEVLEAQQREIGHSIDNPFPVALKADAGAIQGRRMLHMMIEKEKG
jgi:phenylpropionate dioxygenase-like ring-hydroxylating dioxygenase large terminal subunit